MALSNVFREPRRELTESAVGIGIVIVPLAAWWVGANMLATATWDPAHMGLAGKLDVCPYPLWVALCMFVVAVVVALAYGAGTVFLLVSHAVGEGVCNILQDHGLRLRPRLRRIERLDGTVVWIDRDR